MKYNTISSFVDIEFQWCKHKQNLRNVSWLLAIANSTTNKVFQILEFWAADLEKFSLTSLHFESYIKNYFLLIFRFFYTFTLKKKFKAVSIIEIILSDNLPTVMKHQLINGVIIHCLKLMQPLILLGFFQKIWGLSTNWNVIQYTNKIHF